MEDKKWRAQSDLRTLSDAHEIKSDPERMKHVRGHAKEQMASLKTIVQPPRQKRGTVAE